MVDPEKERDDLEAILSDTSAEPMPLSYTILSKITNNFSHLIGRGGFGVVYMGNLRNGRVAVKQLFKIDEFSEKQFEDELICLIRVKHKNIVRLLGYCSDTQKVVVKLNGQPVVADERRRFLCFEYLPNRSLHDYLKDESHRHEWVERYQLIEGICEGLRYLHNIERINHLDLKPENILLDGDMVPKITDFGLSRRFGGDQSRVITKTLFGTPGYAAPEYWDKGEISFKSDIYSLGVIIRKLLTQSSISNSENFHELAGMDSTQVRRCIEIARLCVNEDQRGRPTIDEVIAMLNGKENEIPMAALDLDDSENKHRSLLGQARTSSVSKTTVSVAPPSNLQRLIMNVSKIPGNTITEIRSIGLSESTELLDIYPLELRFPWERYKLIECPVTLTNRMDHHVGVWITPTCPDDVWITPTCIDTHPDFRFPISWGDKSFEDPCSSLFQMIKPHSSWAITMTMKEQAVPPPRKMGNFEVLMVVIESKEQLQNLELSIGSKLSMDIDLLKRVQDLGGEAHRATLTAIVCEPEQLQPNCWPVMTHRIIPETREVQEVLSVDVHPTETWILLCHRECLSIWNYQMQERVMVLQVAGKNGACLVSCAKFIAREKWVATGDDNGWVHVYAYSTKDKLEEFKAHHGDSVSSLAVHPTDSFLLTSSPNDTWIKLWDWSKDWVCTRAFDAHNPCAYRHLWGPWDSHTYDGHILGVFHLAWKPTGSKSFASVSRDGTVKVWEIHSSNPITTLESSYSAGYLCTANYQDAMVACGRGTNSCAYIWDLQTQERVHTFGVCGSYTIEAACHPTLPILATFLNHDTVCLWDAMTYRLVKMVKVIDGPIVDMIFTGSEDLIRLVVACEMGITVMEINFQTSKTDLSSNGGVIVEDYVI